MKKQISCIVFSVLFSCCSGLMSCSSTEDDPINEEDTPAEGVVSSVRMSVRPFREYTGAQTRTTIMDNGSSISITWSCQDVVGIFPKQGTQVAFPILESSAGNNSAVFDGGGWALKDGYAYAAYYPFVYDNFAASIDNIPMDYRGQSQAYNGSTEHLSKFDFMSTPLVVSNRGTLTLDFKHLGSLLKIRLTSPSYTLYKMVLYPDYEDAMIPVRNMLDLSYSDPLFRSIEYEHHLSLDLHQLVVEEGEELTLYMMLPAMQLEYQTFLLNLQTGDGDFLYRITFNAGELLPGYYFDKKARLIGEGSGDEGGGEDPDEPNGPSGEEEGEILNNNTTLNGFSENENIL